MVAGASRHPAYCTVARRLRQGHTPAAPGRDAVRIQLPSGSRSRESWEITFDNLGVNGNIS